MSFLRFLYYKIFLTGRKVGYKNHIYKVLKVEYGLRFGDIYLRLDRKNDFVKSNYTKVFLYSCYRIKQVDKWHSVRKYYRG